MIAKSIWFSHRKYGGWGLTPNCWQGWAYIASIVLLMTLISKLNLPRFWSTGLMLTLGIIFSIDFIDIFIHMKKDERDVIHEAVAERNAMWFMVAALGFGIVYQASIGIVTKTVNIDPVILIALGSSVIVKAATHWYLRNK